MKQFWCLVLALSSCANPIPPTGGPKDLDPPGIIQTIPDNKSLNFNESQIEIEFDEYIKEENLLTQLMITPNLRGIYTHKINRNKITLNFEEPFDSATTYTLNFREGIKDITEGNVPPNLKFVFSTGSFLDSASISGTVRALMTMELLEDITVSLYQDPDTISILDGPPRYSTITGEQGEYLIENIKNGPYHIYALNDQNHNLKLESRSESYGYLDRSVMIDDSIVQTNLLVYHLDTRPIVLQNSRPVGANFDMKFNKSLTEYSLSTDSLWLISNLVEENQTLRIYRHRELKDSIAVHFTVEDSLQQSLDSLIYVKFEESTRSPDKLQTDLSLKNGPINKLFSTKLAFNKPIASINYDSIYFRFDSLFSISLDSSMLSPNYSNDEFHIAVDFNKILENDSIYNKWTLPIEFIISKGSFISVEDDSVASINRELSFKKPKDFGILRGSINTAFNSFAVQLIDNNFDVIVERTYTATNKRNFEFNNIQPGTYSIRVLVDENENGQWDPGNLELRLLPEKVVLFFHPNVSSQQINLRANWEQNELDIAF